MSGYFTATPSDISEKLVVVSTNGAMPDGKLSGERSQALREFLLEQTGKDILFDLGPVTYMDAGSLCVLIDMLKEAKKNYTYVGLYSPSNSVGIMLELMKMNHVLPISNDYEHAKKLYEETVH